MRWWIVFFLLPIASVLRLEGQSGYWQQHRLSPQLREAEIAAVFEDHDGLLWFPSSAGLLRFNGMEFSSYPRTSENPGHASAAFQDHTGRLWVGYRDGEISHLLNNELIPWLPEEGLPSVPITGFAEDANNRIWIATYGEGVYLIADGRMYNINVDDGLPANDVYTIASTPDGDIWLGTDGGFTRCSFNDGVKHLKTVNADNGLPDEIVRILLPDQTGNLWVGTYDRGIAYYDRQKDSFFIPFPEWSHGVITDLTLLNQETLFIGTEEQGGWKFSIRDLTLERLDQTGNPGSDTRPDKVYALHQDRSGNLWMVSSQEGIRHANQRFLGLWKEERNVQAVIASRTGVLWAGTDAGLFRLEKPGQLVPWPGAADLNIVSLYEDLYGNLWAGTFGDGIYLIDPDSGRQRHLGQGEGLLNGSILSIDGAGNNLWLASLGGVAEIRLKGNPINGPVAFGKVKGLNTDFIYQVLADGAGKAWFATDGEGISLLENRHITTYRHIITSAGDSVDLRTVYSLTKTGNGHLWINTARAGLFEFDGTTFTRHQPATDATDTEFTGLAACPYREILMAHTNGIALFNYHSDYSVNYPNEEVGRETFVPNLNAVAADAAGSIWIGGAGGILKYQFLGEAINDRPRTLIRSVTVYPDSKSMPTGTTFAADQNFLAFDYLGLWYDNPQRVRYRYQLEGFDPEWIESRDQRAIYSRLPAGTYTFRVKSSTVTDWNGADEVSYSFTIRKTLWKRWWFVLLTIMLAVVTFLAFVRQRDRRLQRVNMLRKKQAESQYQALKSQINPHFLFNSFNTLIAMIEENPPDAVLYTEKLSDLFRNVLAYRHHESIPVAEELELLANYVFLLDKRFGDKISVRVDLPPQEVHIVPLSLQFLVENAIKHNVVAREKPLLIEIAFDEETNRVCVRNNRQPKLRKEKSTGFGLQSLADRYAILTSRKMRIEEDNDQFVVCLPFLKKNIYENPDR